MEKSTVIEILRTFSKDELARFGKFVSSPYHNKNSNVVKLCGVLLRLAPKFISEKIRKEEIWKTLFPGKKYNYGIMKNLIYNLDKLSQNFLTYEVFQSNEIHFFKFLSVSAREKQLSRLHQKIIVKQKRLIEALPKDEYYYEEKIAFMREHLNFNINNTYIDSAKTDMLESDLKLFLLKYFIGSLSLMTEEQRTNIKHDMSLTGYLFDYMEKNLNKFKNDPILVVYYHLMKSSLELENDEIYGTTRKVVNDNFNLMDYMTKRNCYAVFIAVCNRKIYLSPHKTEALQKELSNPY